MWLNNCVGEHNYRDFILACVFLTVNMISALGLQSSASVSLQKEEAPSWVLFSTVAFSVILSAAILIFACQLLAYHIYFAFH
mmetsp:Transcript_14298/g.22259  ORF Transcript_14298/g.22259 Transcript_14298/m.22259 type:complete len:82 (-) Transcript_14298:350-595(-)